MGNLSPDPKKTDTAALRISLLEPTFGATGRRLNARVALVPGPKSRTASLLLAASLYACGANAQTAPPEIANQEFLRQQERERALREQQQQPSPDVFLKPEAPALTGSFAPEQPCFAIERIKEGLNKPC